MNTALDAAINSTDLAKYNVILVDDEQNILLSLQRSFRREPYGFHCATSGSAGLELLTESQNVAVIISDQRMPGMNGSEFLARSKQLAPNAIRMLLTGYSDMEATIAAMNEGGATHYISKPWNDSVLLQTVRDCVRQYHLLEITHIQQETINRQNEELKSWNTNLKDRVMQQTAQLRKQIEDIRRLNKRQQANSQSLIEAMVALAELRDHKLRGHSSNTATLSVAIARSLNLSPQEIETIRIAALLHDIGKNALSDVELATDSDDLTGEALNNYQKHPVLGQTALDSIEDLRPVGVLIRHHHERYDGTGFPDGLQGSSIPLGSAIIFLADRFDQEIAKYVGSNAVESALENISKSSGTLFSPALLSHLVQPAHALYDGHFERHDELVEIEATPKELKAGMVLTRDLFSRSGLLLLQAWTILDRAKIESLKRIFTIDPMPGGIWVAIRNTR